MRLLEIGERVDEVVTELEHPGLDRRDHVARALLVFVDVVVVGPAAELGQVEPLVLEIDRGVIVQTVASVIAAPLQLIISFGAFLINPNGDNTGLAVAGIVVYLLTNVLTVVFGAISAVVMSATPALIYIDIRMRKEGLDLELIRFVEARQSGDASVPDPYLVRAGAASPTATEGSPWS